MNIHVASIPPSWRRRLLLSCAAMALGCSTIDSKATLIDSDGDGSPDVRDCAPDDPDIAPGLDEVCDGEDQDCDGEIDENPIDATEEICDGIDNDCDGEIDEGVEYIRYPDEDGDGFGDGSRPVSSCDPDPELLEDGSDCNDEDATIFPGQDEVCDGIDNDCDLEIDEDLTRTFYADTDGDGFGDADNPAERCEEGDGYLEDANDCNDNDVTIYPGAPESCNDDIDQDCDGEDTYCLIYGDLLVGPDADITISGLGSGSLTGEGVGFAGDVNGDGTPDLYVSSPSFDNGGATRANVGLVDIISIEPSFTQGQIDLSDSSGTGWTSTGIIGIERNNLMGSTANGVGDVDGDGLDDFVVASTLINGLQVGGGAAYLVLGSSMGSNLLVSDADLTFSPNAGNQFLGSAVVPAGDLNGDGFDDLILGGEGKLYDGNNRPGAIMLWLGCEGGMGNCEDPDGDGSYESTYRWGQTATPDEADQWLLGQERSYDRAGSAIAANFDFNGDGSADILIGARGALDGAGEVYLVLDYPFSSDTAWSQAEVILQGKDATDGLGSVLQSPGDLDGDGYDDIILGVPAADSSTGAVYIFLGRDDIELSHLSRELSVEDVEYKLVGEQTGEEFGSSLAGSGDVDGDGIVELMVGAPRADVDGVFQAGEVRILRGPPAADMADDPLARISGTRESSRAGISLAGGVDINADGWTEVLIGASRYDDAGSAFLLFGGYHP